VVLAAVCEFLDSYFLFFYMSLIFLKKKTVIH